MRNVRFITLLLLIPIAILIGSAWMSFDFLSTIEKNYYDYVKKYPYVTVNMVFNQPAYAIGDTVFFSVRYQYENKEYVKGTHLIKLDLIGGNGTTAQSIRFKVTDGKGYNQIVLNKDLEEGIYKFYAYSDWMRNFGTGALFQRDISVLKRQQLVKSEKKGVFHFYPEGGKLVGGIENNVLVVGDPRSDLIIKDETGVEYSRVKIDSLGLGSFLLTPQVNRKYVASHVNPSLTVNLPEVEADGVSTFFNQSTWDVKLKISRSSQFNQKELYALVLSDGIILSKQTVRLNSENHFTLKLPERSQPETLYQLYIIDEKGSEIAQRVFASGDAAKVNSNVTLAGTPKQNEKASLQLDFKDEAGRDLEADISVSILQENLFPFNQKENLLYLFEAPRVHAWTTQYSVSRADLVNTYLISEKWNRINWANVYGDIQPRFVFPFNSAIKFKGQVVSKITNAPAPDSTLVIGFLQNNVMGYEAYTRNGFFEIPLVFDFWGIDQIFITLRNKKKCVDDNYNVQFVPDTIAADMQWKTNVLNDYDAYADFALKRNLISDSYKFYLNERGNNALPKSANEILEEEFQGVDHTINVADYIVFPTMEDLLSEVVTFVQFKKKGNESFVRLFYRYEKSVVFYKGDPIYVIDGVMTTSTEEFLKLKPEDLLTIKIINNPNKLAQLGNLGLNGIIFVESRKGNLARNFKRNLFSVTGLSQAKLSDNRSLTRNPKVPDLKANLLWIPFLNSNESTAVDFTLSDDVGPMKVYVQGATKNGKYFHYEKAFTVQKNSVRK